MISVGAEPRRVLAQCVELPHGQWAFALFEGIYRIFGRIFYPPGDFGKNG